MLGSLSHGGSRAGITADQIVPTVDELVVAAEAVTAEMTQQQTCQKHPHATIYPHRRQGGGSGSRRNVTRTRRRRRRRRGQQESNGVKWRVFLSFADTHI